MYLISHKSQKIIDLKVKTVGSYLYFERLYGVQSGCRSLIRELIFEIQLVLTLTTA